MQKRSASSSCRFQSSRACRVSSLHNTSTCVSQDLHNTRAYNTKTPSLLDRDLQLQSWRASTSNTLPTLKHTLNLVINRLVVFEQKNPNCAVLDTGPPGLEITIPAPWETMHYFIYLVSYVSFHETWIWIIWRFQLHYFIYKLTRAKSLCWW